MVKSAINFIIKLTMATDFITTIIAIKVKLIIKL
jgi:hypothetical protein